MANILTMKKPKRNQIIAVIIALIAIAIVVYFHSWQLAVAQVLLFWAYSLES